MDHFVANNRWHGLGHSPRSNDPFRGLLGPARILQRAPSDSAASGGRTTTATLSYEVLKNGELKTRLGAGPGMFPHLEAHIVTHPETGSTLVVLIDSLQYAKTTKSQKFVVVTSYHTSPLRSPDTNTFNRSLFDLARASEAANRRVEFVRSHCLGGPALRAALTDGKHSIVAGVASLTLGDACFNGDKVAPEKVRDIARFFGVALKQIEQSAEITLTLGRDLADPFVLLDGTSFSEALKSSHHTFHVKSTSRITASALCAILEGAITSHRINYGAEKKALQNPCIGILGYGTVGKQVANILKSKGFNNLIVCDSDSSALSRASEDGFSAVERSKLFEQSNFLLCVANSGSLKYEDLLVLQKRQRETDPPLFAVLTTQHELTEDLERRMNSMQPADIPSALKGMCTQGIPDMFGSRQIQLWAPHIGGVGGILAVLENHLNPSNTSAQNTIAIEETLPRLLQLGIDKCSISISTVRPYIMG